MENFANKLQEELGINVTTIKEWSGWNDYLTPEQNRQWIKELKEEGYTFYDIGFDPDFGPPTGDWYQVEIEEIFDGEWPVWPLPNTP